MENVCFFSHAATDTLQNVCFIQSLSYDKSSKQKTLIYDNDTTVRGKSSKGSPLHNFQATKLMSGGRCELDGQLVQPITDAFNFYEERDPDGHNVQIELLPITRDVWCQKTQQPARVVLSTSWGRHNGAKFDPYLYVYTLGVNVPFFGSKRYNLRGVDEQRVIRQTILNYGIDDYYYLPAMDRLYSTYGSFQRTYSDAIDQYSYVYRVLLDELDQIEERQYELGVHKLLSDHSSTTNGLEYVTETYSMIRNILSGKFVLELKDLLTSNWRDMFTSGFIRSQYGEKLFVQDTMMIIDIMKSTKERINAITSPSRLTRDYRWTRMGYLNSAFTTQLFLKPNNDGWEEFCTIFGATLNPANFWDMVPMSFVADWFLPVQDLIDLKTRAVALNVLTVGTSRKVRMKVNIEENLYLTDFHRLYRPISSVGWDTFSVSLPNSTQSLIGGSLLYQFSR